MGSSFNATLQSETASENLDNLIAKDRQGRRPGWEEEAGWNQGGREMRWNRGRSEVGWNRDGTRVGMSGIEQNIT